MIFVLVSIKSRNYSKLQYCYLHTFDTKQNTQENNVTLFSYQFLSTQILTSCATNTFNSWILEQETIGIADDVRGTKLYKTVETAVIVLHTTLSLGHP